MFLQWKLISSMQLTIILSRSDMLAEDLHGFFLVSPGKNRLGTSN